MTVTRIAGLASIMLVLCARASGAQSATPAATLTFEQAIARAREQAPRVLVARARIEETRARLAGASLRLQNNPVIEAAAGPRRVPGDQLTDFDVGVSQTFELGGRRAARIAGAEAGIARDTAQAESATRALVQEAAEAFFRAVFAREQLAILADAALLAQDIARVAQRRYAAGDIAILDVNLANADASRAAARVRIARAAQRDALGDLRRLLGIDGDTPLDVQGDLRRASPYTLSDLLARPDARPELRVLDAETVEAEADVRLARGLARPDFGLGVRYARDAGDRLVTGGLTITLPLFSRGQELEATGTARARRARLERQATRASIEQDVRTAFGVYQEQVAAVTLFERDALPGLTENEALARRSFDVGQISLPDLLVVRREILGTRLEHLDALRDATLAGLRQELAAGVLP